MSERPPLPKRPYPLVLPPAGGFDDVVRRGRSLRRRRAAGVGGAAMTLVVGVLGATLLRTPGDTLRELPADQVPSTSPSPARPDDLRPTPRSSGSAPRGTAHAAGRPTKAPAGQQATPTPKPPVGTKAPKLNLPSPKPRVEKPPIDILDEQAAANDCLPATEPSGWCDQVYATKVSNGVKLTLKVCPTTDSSQGPGILHFANSQQADYVILDPDGQEIWRWSTGQAFTTPGETANIDRGWCRRWETVWNGTDESGAAVAAGRYTLRTWSTADEMAGRAPKAQTFDL